MYGGQGCAGLWTGVQMKVEWAHLTTAATTTTTTCDTKKRELLKNPTKIEEIQEKKIVDRN